MRHNMTEEEFKELVSKIDSEVLPTRIQPTEEEEEEARKAAYERQKEWTEWNAS